MRRRLGDLRATEPQWQFGSAMNDMLGADTGPIRPPAAPEPMVEQEHQDQAHAVDAEPDPLTAVPEPEEAMRLVEDQARRLRELAAESLDAEDRRGAEPEQSGDAEAAGEVAAPPLVMPSMQFVTDAEQRYREHAEAEDAEDADAGEAWSEPGDPATDPAVVADAGIDQDRPVAMPPMEFVTDAEERFREYADADRPGPSEDLPADELAAALESMLQAPGSSDADRAGDEGSGSEVADGDDDPTETLDRTLERMIDEGHRGDLDPAFEPPSGVDDGDDAAARPLAMEFVVHADDLRHEDPEDLESGEGDLPPPAAAPASRRAALKAVRGAMAAKAAALAPVRKALGDDGWGDVDESSLSPAQLTSLMVNLDQTLADGVETLLESSYDAVADILDLVFEEIEESDVAGEEDELLEEAEIETRPSGRRREERGGRDSEAAEGTGRGEASEADPLDAAGEMAGVDDLDVEFDEVDLDEPGTGSPASKPGARTAPRGKTARISPPPPAGPGVLEALVAKVRGFRGDWAGAGVGVVRTSMAVLSRPLDHVPPDWRTTVDWVAISLAFWVPIVWLLVVFVF